MPIFIEHGFAGARVDEIAEQVGVSKPVIYKIFDGKDELAAAVVEEAHRIEAGFHIEVGAVEAYEQIAEGRITPLYEAAFPLAAEHRALSRFLYIPLRDAPPAAAEFHEECFRMRTLGVEHYALQYFAGREDAEERAHQFGRAASAIGRLGLAKVAAYDDLGEADALKLARDYGKLLEQGVQGV